MHRVRLHGRVHRAPAKDHAARLRPWRVAALLVAAVMRPNGFYWVRTTPDSMWLPAMWTREFGWSVPGVEYHACYGDDGIWDDYMADIGEPVAVPDTYAAFNAHSM